jgi:prepilin-type N-terminal cleavage/methylation domain-containing protein
MKKLKLSSKVRKAFRGSSRGFSMLEVVIAIALLGIVALSVLTALSTASAALIIADRRATAESLARSQMEFIKEQDYIDYSASEHPDYDLISVDGEGYWIGLAVEELVTDEEQTKLQKVKVIVTYYILGAENKEVERQFTLEGYNRES